MTASDNRMMQRACHIGFSFTDIFTPLVSGNICTHHDVYLIGTRTIIVSFEQQHKQLEVEGRCAHLIHYA